MGEHLEVTGDGLAGVARASRRSFARLGWTVIAFLSLACGDRRPHLAASADLDADGLADLEEEAISGQYRPVWTSTYRICSRSLEEVLAGRAGDGLLGRIRALLDSSTRRRSRSSPTASW